MATKTKQPETETAVESPVVLDPLAELESLMKRADEIRDNAKARALETINGQIAALGRIGFVYTLVEGAKPSNGQAAAARGKGGQYDPARFCSICQMQGHDKRAHRGQSVATKFTPTELANMGLQVR